MKKIVIKINCGETTCDNCEFVYGTASGFTPFCGQFDDCETGSSVLTRSGGTFMRLPECKQAEVKDE